MADTGLNRLFAWLSPAFPVGAFAFSAGLETAIANGTVRDKTAMADWLDASLTHGGLKTDAVLLALAHRAAGDRTALAELADLCLALSPAIERRAELIETGTAFVIAAKTWPADGYETLPDPCPYPIAVGAVARAHALPLAETLGAFLTAAAQTQISVALRLVPLGQSKGLEVLAGAEPAIAGLAEFAKNAGHNDLGSIAYAADIAMMAHETVQPRIFRS